MNRKNLITALVSLAIAIVLVYFQMKNLDLTKVKSILKNANLFFVIPSAILGFLALLFRSMRWQLMLKSMEYKVSSLNCFGATAITYLANIFIPRSGELFRCTSLYKSENVPVNKSFGSVLAERVIDLFTLIFILLLTAIFNYDLFFQFLADVYQKKTENSQGFPFGTMIGIFFALILAAFLFFLGRNYFKKSTFYEKFTNFLEGLKEGILSVVNLKQRNLFVLYSLLIWICYYYMTYIVVFSLEESSHLTHSQGLFLLFAGAIGMIVPSSGGIGPYHISMGLAFVMMGLTKELGNSVAILIHTPQTILMLSMGLIGIFITLLGGKKKVESTE